MNLDARRPTITITSQPTASHTNAAERQSVGAGSTAAIGSDITYSVEVSDAIGSLTVRTEELNTSTTFWHVPNPTVTSSKTTATHTVPVKETGVDNYRNLNAQNVKFTVAAVDDAGNVATNVDTPTILVDNVRPPTSLDWRADRAFLNLAPGTDASVVKTGWASSAAAADLAHAKVTLDTNEHTPTSKFATTAAGAAFPLTFADPYTATVNVTMSPIDAAGNINTGASLVQSPPFITGVNVAYGATPVQPVAVGKSAVHNVYVNTSSALAPTPTFLPPTAPVAFGQFLRNGTGSAVDYWENGTPGSSKGGAGNAPNYFQPSSTINTDLDPHAEAGETVTNCDDNTNPEPNTNTAFQPSASGSGTTSAKGAYVFTNLSSLGPSTNCLLHRAFLGGAYQLHVNLSTPDGARTNVVRYFFIDADPPALMPNKDVGAVKHSSSYTAGPGQNWTDLHGMDNNPFRVFYNPHDSRVETGLATGATLTDSKLRNVTFELVQQDGSAVVRRTATTDVASTPDDESLARINIDLTKSSTGAPSYFYDFRSRDPSVVPNDVCPTGDPFHVDCIWFRVRGNNNHSMSWFNDTNFSGWVNVTFPDLPAGKFKVRALAYDRAGGLLSTTYPTSNADADVFRIAPAVKILTSATSPAVTADRKLDVVVGASARYLDPATLPPAIGSRCVTNAGAAGGDVCPAELVKVFVSNTNGASDAGVLYWERAGDFVSSDAPTTQTSKGFVPGSYTNARQGQPTFSSTGFSFQAFKYHRDVSTLGALPSSIDVQKTVYVRAEVYDLDAAGNALISRTTEWIRAASSTEKSLSINQPPIDPRHPADEQWPLNLSTSDMTKQPPFNVTFDRKGEPGAVKLQYKIIPWTTITSANPDGTPLVTENALLPDTTPINPTPEFLFNWSGTLKNGANPLAAGSYLFRVCVYAGADTCGVAGSNKLGEAWRNFTILPSKPTLVIAADQPDKDHLVADPTVADKYYVGEAFDLRFTMNQGEANLSGWLFELKRENPPAGQPSAFTSPGDGTGTGGFTVTVFEPLPEHSEKTSTFNARVRIPTGIANQETLKLTVTGKFDVYPFKIGNASDLITLVHDKAAPTAALQEGNTLDTVFLTGSTSPPKNRDQTNGFKPAFEGTAADPGSGIKLAEVRVVDLTLGKTLSFLTTPINGRGAILLDGTNVDSWVNSTTIASAGTSFVKLVSVGNGQWTWKLPLLETGTLPKLVVLDADGSVNETQSVINLSHLYRVDHRFTDNLGQLSPIRSSSLDFDARPPYLGYKGQLGVPTSTPSGISAPKKTITWHGEGDSLVLTAHATDNHCLAAVRLVGFSEINPTKIVKANMTPFATYATFAADSTSTPIADASRVCPNGLKVGYRIDLADADHMTDDVANYTYWFEAEDWAGQVSEVESAHRLLKIEVLDNTPASVRSVAFDPPVGQAGGRTLVRAEVFENFLISHVTIQFRDFASNALLAQANMTPENETKRTGLTLWRSDTTDDLNLTLEARDYLVNVTAYDVNWNRTPNPTCAVICQPFEPLYRVRDDGAPAVVLESPLAGATINATPTIKYRALHKALETDQISVRATTDGDESNLTEVPSSEVAYTELKATNGSRQGWTVVYTPATLTDNQTLLVNVSAAIGSLFDAKQHSFRVDAAAPEVSANVTGGTRTIGDKTWATRATRVALTANDTVSATTILYAVNGGAQQTYTGEITPSGPDGEWKLEYWASDAAGNLAAKQTITLNLDQTGPRISVAKHGDDLLLTVTDGTGVGLNESSVTVHYRYGAATAYATKKADKLTGNSYGTTLPGNATADGLAYYFTAEDVLDNTGTNFTATAPYRIDGSTPAANLPPTIRITAPSAGTIARNAIELRWLAEDPEDASLTITIALRQPEPGRVLVAAGENSGAYTINTTGFPAGAYTVVVTANDGENNANAQVTFNVDAGETIQVRNVPPATVAPNTQVAIAVAINAAGKTVQTAQYRLIKDGELLTSGILSPTQGLYAAGFTPSQPGAYTVIVDVTYTDGTTEPPKQVATFSVPGAPTPPDEGGAGLFPTSLMVLLAVAILTVALAAYGAFGRWKK